MNRLSTAEAKQLVALMQKAVSVLTVAEIGALMAFLLSEAQRQGRPLQ